MKNVVILISFLLIISDLSAQADGNILILDGTNDHIEVPDNNSLDFNEEVTLECWLYVPCNQPGYKGIINKQWCQGGQFAYALGIRDGIVEWTWVNTQAPSCGASNTYKSSNTVIPSDTWIHIAATHTISAVNLYINGILIEGTLSNGIYSDIRDSNQPLKIGVYRPQSGVYQNHLKGALDEIRIWDYARTANEITNDYNQVLSGNETGLVAYYNMNINEVGEGFTLPNQATSTGNTNDGESIGTTSTPYFLATEANLFFLGDNIESVVDVEICEGESYFAAGEEQTTAGLYLDIYPLANGCNEFANTNLTVINDPNICLNTTDDCLANAGILLTANDTVCIGTNLSIQAHNFTTADTYEQAYILTNESGIIVDVNATGIFEAEVGMYSVYAFNYLITDVTLPSIGEDIALYETPTACFELTQLTQAAVVPEIDIFVELQDCQGEQYLFLLNLDGGLPTIGSSEDQFVYQVGTGNANINLQINESIYEVTLDNILSLNVTDGVCSKNEYFFFSNK